MIHLLHHHDGRGHPSLEQHAETPPLAGDAPGVERRRRLAFAVVLMCCFISVVDLTVVNLALPAIAIDLRVGTNALQWVVDSYNLTLAGLLLLGGGLADRFGRKRILLIGITLFGLGSLFAALAGSVTTLIAARTVMGVGAAFVLTPTMAMISVLFPVERRSRAIAMWAIVGGLGIAVGPLIGGVLLESFSWQSVFLINLPFIAVAVGLGIAVLPESVRPGASRLDLTGAALSVVGLGTLMFGIIEGPARGWASPVIVGSLVAGVAFLAGFVRWELRCAEPMFDLRILRIPPVAGGAFVLLVGYISMTAMLFLVPTWLQSVQQLSVIATGIALLAFAVPFGLMSNLVPRLILRVRPNRLMLIGLVLATVGAVLFAVAPTWGETPLAAVGFAVAGVSIALMVTPSSTTIINGLPEEKAGEGSSLSMLARFLGAVLGVAVAGTVFSVVFSSRVEREAAALGVPLTDATANSFHNTVAEAVRVGGATGQDLIAAAHRAFDAGFAWAFGVVGAICTAGLLVMVLVDRRSGGNEEEATPTRSS